MTVFISDDLFLRETLAMGDEAIAQANALQPRAVRHGDLIHVRGVIPEGLGYYKRILSESGIEGMRLASEDNDPTDPGSDIDAMVPSKRWELVREAVQAASFCSLLHARAANGYTLEGIEKCLFAEVEVKTTPNFRRTGYVAHLTTLSFANFMGAENPVLTTARGVSGTMWDSLLHLSATYQLSGA